MAQDRYSELDSAFYLLNRGVLRADMIEFIASMQSNVQTLTMDDAGTTRARVSDQVTHSYDYSEAIADIEAAAALIPDFAYFHFDLGNLYCLSSRLVEAIDSYDKAISLHPYMGDAYYNRGLVLIYLKDKEKGCIDLSRAGELGVADSYSVISKYCEDEQQ
jgi:tetratricopeptide (TPR) repeat protein